MSGTLRGGLRRVRAHPRLNPLALCEDRQERRGGHPADVSHRSHLEAALAWLEAAQDATRDGGVSRGFSLTWHPEFGTGWQPPYPETTGYIIPTLYEAARYLGRARLAERAERAARWEVRIQLPSGAVQAGVLGAPLAPAVFNTGQVMFGWLAAFRETGDDTFAEAVRRAGDFLVATQEVDGLWRRDNSPYARADSTLYNAQAA